MNLRRTLHNRFLFNSRFDPVDIYQHAFRTTRSIELCSASAGLLSQLNRQIESRLLSMKDTRAMTRINCTIS